MADTQEDKAAEPKDGPQKSGEAKRPLSRTTIALIAGAILFVMLGIVAFWLHERHFESTDDAFIDGHIIQVSARIPGRIERLLVDDNEAVREGQVLATLDPRDQQVRLDQARAQQANAEAQLAQAEAQLAVQQANRIAAVANLEASDADLMKARQDLVRYRHIDARAVSRQDIDTVVATARSAEAKRASLQAAIAGSDAQLIAARAQIRAAQAAIEQAATQVADAQLQLSYTSIIAPESGRVTHRTVETGTYASPGQALLAIVPDDLWVTANFKESQLTYMRRGQPVEIVVDAFPDVTFRGHVDSFQRGTGSILSILPPENATGNYVKVVQRLPVKIRFDDDRVKDFRLAPGLSVTPTVTVR